MTGDVEQVLADPEENSGGGRRRRVVGAVLAVALFGGIVGYQRVPVYALATIFTGGSAKMLCSAVFVADRDEAVAYEQDFRRLTKPGKYLGVVHPVVNHEDRSVTASLWGGLASRTAIHREGIGCTTAEGVSVAELRAQGEGVPTSLPEPDPAEQWPQGSATLAASPPGVDRALLTQALDDAFAEPDPDEPRNTRGIVVVHAGRIIAERYADGFDQDTAHLSNSVAKSLTATLVGILVGQGRLDVNAPAPVAEWQGDERAEITLDDLLYMSSGLQFGEDYTRIKSDITMQYVGGDLAGFAASRPLEAEPGTRWQYSTGTANLLGRIVREAAGPDFPTAFAFPRRALFDPLGMRSAVLEPDAAGNFVGGSSAYLSVRDYARLGLLYLQDGVWDGERILPEDWVDYVRTPVPDSPSDYPYGAQFWLNIDAQGAGGRYPALPHDAYFMIGHQGQYVVVVPSEDLIVARNGLSEFDNWSIEALVADVLAALTN